MNRKLLLFLLILISIGTISHVSAADNSTFVAQDDSIETVGELETETPDVLGDNPATYYVNSGGSIQDAINMANSGDTIILNGTFEVKNTIVIDKEIIISGCEDGAIIKPNAFNVNKITLVNVNSNASNVILSNLKFIGGHSIFAGAILWEGSDGSINNCEFSGNVATGSYGGAVVLTGNRCNLNDCTFEDNSAIQGDDAGAIFLSGDYCNLINCTFRGNKANRDGGAIVLNGTSCAISYCTFTSNQASRNGGAIVINGKKNNIAYTVFEKNYLLNSRNDTSILGGGALYCSCENLVINYCEFYENDARDGNGGAIVLNEYNTVRNSIFKSNLALLGRDIFGTTSTSVYSNHFTIRYDENETVSVYGCEPENVRDNTFNRTKVDSDVKFTARMIFEYGDVGSIYVIVIGGTVEQENIKVLNHPEAKHSISEYKQLGDNAYELKVWNLAVGNYVLRVTTTPDENHTSTDEDLNITVKKATAVVKASKMTVALKSGSKWTIKLVNSKTNKPISGMYLTLKVYTNKKYKSVKVKTNSKGVATYKTKDLLAGTHKIVVSGTHKSYTFKTLTSSIKVIKQTPLSFKLKQRVNDKGGSLLSYMVTNKNTGKGINGVKIKCLIYTGKKYKTMHLTTKKIVGKKATVSGALGFSTNDFSAGKHVVKLIPENIKYKGSVTTYIKLSKSAVKGLKYFNEI